MKTAELNIGGERGKSRFTRKLPVKSTNGRAYDSGSKRQRIRFRDSRAVRTRSTRWDIASRAQSEDQNALQPNFNIGVLALSLKFRHWPSVNKSINEIRNPQLARNHVTTIKIPPIQILAANCTWKPLVASSTKRFDPKDLTTWHTTNVLLPPYWSCDWPNWDQAKELRDGGLSTVWMRRRWGIAGEIEPLAFVPNELIPEPTCVFFAGGMYYWWRHGDLWRHEGPFADHDDFLRRLWDQAVCGGGIPMSPLEQEDDDEYFQLEDYETVYDADFLRFPRDKEVWDGGIQMSPQQQEEDDEYLFPTGRL
ncbi:hypothetical protein DFH07DRAFT_1025518 [Mycena maculata]|uniref:Uncharacterized protein n=1 Tax=Mycena maculata TaxID=230809 RepID=A0AAD7J690_9AGAR|nr:hypothetical protein DFH07DRAFT_1025518 [Mycena maculata]